MTNFDVVLSANDNAVKKIKVGKAAGFYEVNTEMIVVTSGKIGVEVIVKLWGSMF